MRGIPRKTERYNFTDEGANLRWAEYCLMNGLDMHKAEPPDHLCYDIRQASTRQLKGGSASLLAKSRVYHFKTDRILIPEELMRCHGWPASLALHSINDVHEAFLAPDKK